jgi:8-oxo-dGTP pyrophosphatase MutT (NUDIX family)
MTTTPLLEIPQFATKVVLYVTHEDTLLVFREPAYPHIALQVPGGTVEPDEEIETAARRELLEETGLADISSLISLGSRAYEFHSKGRACRHTRHHFHITLPGVPRERWSHWEQDSSLGLGPIEFDLFWMPFVQAADELGYGFGPPILDFMPQLLRV